MARQTGGTDSISNLSFTNSSTNPFTIAMWFFSPATETTDYGTLVEADVTNLSGSLNVFGIWLRTTSPAHIAWYVGAAAVDPGAATISASKWYHIALTSTGVIAQGYINGATDGIAFTPTTGRTSANLYVFNDPTGNHLDSGARAADVVYWSVALTPLEILALAQGTRPKLVRPASLAGPFWPCDGLVSPEPDLSGHQLNGTVSGTSRAFGPPFSMLSPRGSQFMAPVTVPTLMPQILL
jgi:hypothetical protein